MAVLDRVPRAALAFGLGLITSGYVLPAQPYRDLSSSGAVTARVFRSGARTKVWLGFVLGIVFGASNITVQVVAYLDHLELDHPTFLGVLAMVLVGISTVRVGAAWSLGLYGAASLLAISAVGVVPGLVGVFGGRRVRPNVPVRYQPAGTLGLRTVIALRLTTVGLHSLSARSGATGSILVG